MSSTRVILDPQRASDGQAIPFDFTSKLQSGQTISSAALSAAVWSGNDSNPSTVLASLTGTVSGAIVYGAKAPAGGVAGTVYLLKCAATLSGGQGTVAVLEALLAILPDGI